MDESGSESSPEDLSAHAGDLKPLALSSRSELTSASEALARAFRDNPLNTAVIQAGPKKRYRSNLAGMRSLLAVALGHALLLSVRDPATSAPTGVLIGVEPFGYPLPGASFAGHLRCLVMQGPGAMSRWGQVYRALEAAHPIEPHWYLAVLGIEPERQREGNGAALLRAFVAKVDAEGGPSYLETDREENIAFYAREGFEVVREVSVLGVPVWCMWRRGGVIPAGNAG